MRLAHLAAGLTALLALAATAGCQSTKESNVTKEEAVARVAQRADEAFQHLPPGATLKQRLHTPDVPCDNGGDTTFVETAYDVVFDDGWPADRSMNDLATYWAGNGYDVVRDDRASKSAPELVVEKKDDGFRVGYLLVHADDGKTRATLRSSSPCLG